MNKRIIILILLLLNVFFYSCSSKKNTTTINSKTVVIPVHSNSMHENWGEKQKKNKKELDPKQQHYNRQTESVQKQMKRNEKISMKNTPVHKKKSCNSLFNRKNRVCGNRIDKAVLDDGVRDVRQ